MKTILVLLFIPSVAFARCDFGSAISTIRPNSEWVVYDNDLSTLIWNDTSTVKPSQAEIQAAITSCQAQQVSAQAQRVQDIATAKNSASAPQVRLDALIRLLNIQ